MAKPSLYLAHSNTIENLVFQLPDEINTIAVVAHNPGVTDYANTLVTHPFMNSMPTGAVIAVKCNSDNWADFYSGNRL